MKKILGLLGILIFALSGCNDDEEDVAQISFSFTNMTTLLGKSGSYIKQASPGTFYRYVEYVDYSYYTFLFDEIAVLGDMALNYNMIDDSCNDIMVYTESDELATAQELMLIAAQELGEASVYVLHFIYDSTVFEITFSTYVDLWDYIEQKSYTVEDIYELYSAYLYTDHTVYAGGFWEGGEFWPFAEITGPGKKSTAAQPHFRSWQGKMQRPPSHW